MAGKRENKILVVIKKPNEQAYVEPVFDNTLESFQNAVGGYIETVTIATDLIFIVNEEGWLLDLPYNTTVCGLPLYGNVIAVGTKKDGFASLKASVVPHVLKLLNGEK